MKILIGFLISLLAGLYNAHILSFLWLWFVVPLGVIPVGTLHMWGLLVLASVTQLGVYIKLEEIQPAPKELSVSILRTVLTSTAITLMTGVAFGIHKFM